MRPGYTTVTIGRTALEVPIHIDPSASQEIADAITQRLQELEEEGGRIDTVAYALKTAYEYALRLEQRTEESDSSDSATQESLERLLSRLKSLLQSLPIPESTEQP